MRLGAIECAKNSCDLFVSSQSASPSLNCCCLPEFGVTLAQGELEPCTLLPSSAVFSDPPSVEKGKELIVVYNFRNFHTN